MNLHPGSRKRSNKYVSSTYASPIDCASGTDSKTRPAHDVHIEKAKKTLARFFSWLLIRRTPLHKCDETKENDANVSDADDDGVP
jgi:hypothetical protein